MSLTFHYAYSTVHRVLSGTFGSSEHLDRVDLAPGIVLYFDSNPVGTLVAFSLDREEFEQNVPTPPCERPFYQLIRQILGEEFAEELTDWAGFEPVKARAFTISDSEVADLKKTWQQLYATSQ
jgi:hypothetical protein